MFKNQFWLPQGCLPVKCTIHIRGFPVASGQKYSSEHRKFYPGDGESRIILLRRREFQKILFRDEESSKCCPGLEVSQRIHRPKKSPVFRPGAELIAKNSPSRKNPLVDFLIPIIAVPENLSPRTLISENLSIGITSTAYPQETVPSCGYTTGITLTKSCSRVHGSVFDCPGAEIPRKLCPGTGMPLKFCSGTGLPRKFCPGTEMPRKSRKLPGIFCPGAKTLQTRHS